MAWVTKSFSKEIHQKGEKRKRKKRYWKEREEGEERRPLATSQD